MGLQYPQCAGVRGHTTHNAPETTTALKLLGAVRRYQTAPRVRDYVTTMPWSEGLRYPQCLRRGVCYTHNVPEGEPTPPKPPPDGLRSYNTPGLGVRLLRQSPTGLGPSMTASGTCPLSSIGARAHLSELQL